jgi:hypothetical protein
VRQVSKGRETHGRNERLLSATAGDATDSTVVQDPGVDRFDLLFGAIRTASGQQDAIGSEAWGRKIRGGAQEASHAKATERQEGSGRSDAVRLPARNEPS